MPDSQDVPIENLQRSLGLRIRELRSKHGWTQEQFAEVCGLHRTYMGHVERGEKNVSLSTVAKVANALGVRISALFGRPQAPAHICPPVTGPARATAGHSQVSQLLNELHAQRKAMKEMLRDLSSFLARVSRMPS